MNYFETLLLMKQGTEWWELMRLSQDPTHELLHFL